MIGSRTVLMVVLSLGMAGALSTPVLAQAAGGGGGRQRGGGAGGGAGGGGGRQRLDPAQMRERMMTQLKEALGATDEEWTALQPKVEKVMTAQQANRAGGGAGGRRGGAGGGGAGAAPADNTPQSPVAAASKDLQDALGNKDSTPEQIKVKLQALRDARTKAHTDLAAAQAELKEVLTARQEAVLVARGMLE